MRRLKLSLENPAFAVEWDYEKNAGLHPDNFTGSSNKKVWWKCNLGHSWCAVIASRFMLGSKCPYCTNRKVLQGFNDLQTGNPAVAAQWDVNKNSGRTPDSVAANSNKKAWWRCDKGHSWQADIESRNQGCGCPYCTGRVALAGFNDLATLRPEIAAQWDNVHNNGLTAEMVTLGSNKKIWWVCERGHRWQASVVTRVKGHRCSYCTGKKPIVGETDFATIHPELLDEWDYELNIGIKPQDITAASNKKVWWRCEKGHSWKSHVYTRHNGSKCTICQKLANKHKVIVGQNDLATTHYAIAQEWDFDRNNLVPQQVSPGSGEKYWWKCKHGHRWQASVLSRTMGTQCPRCSGKTHTKTIFIT